MKTINQPSLFEEGTVFVGRINKKRFKIIKLYQTGEKRYSGNSGGYSICSEPMAEIEEVETNKRHLHSIQYLSHLLVDIERK